MLEVGSLVWMYPYDIKGLTEDQKLSIPAYYRQGEGDLVAFYLVGDVVSDDGVELQIKTTDTHTTYTSEWLDIFKVVVKSDPEGNPPKSMKGRTQWGGLSGKYVAPKLIGPLYGGGKATDQLSKEGSYTYVLIGACLVGIFIYMR